MQTDNRSSAIQSLLQSGGGDGGRYRTDSDGRASEKKKTALTIEMSKLLT